MILDAILTILANVAGIILAPLEVLNIGVDLLSGYTTLLSFFQVIAYLIPWSNLLPLFVLAFAIMNFKTIIAFIKFILSFIPFMG